MPDGSGDVQRLRNLIGSSLAAGPSQLAGNAMGEYFVGLLHDMEYGEDSDFKGIIKNFYDWSINQGVNADPNDPNSVMRFFDHLERQENWNKAVEQKLNMQELLYIWQQRAQGDGGGRVLFAEEAELMRQQALSEEFNRKLTAAASRIEAQAKLDAERRARTEAILTSLIGAAPYMINPEEQYFPGLEPGGVGEALGGLLGAGIGPREIPTATLPISRLMEAPLMNEAEINELLTGRP